MNNRVIRLETWAEGPEGSGQGGLTAYRLSRAAGRPLSVRFHAPIPIETDLAIIRTDTGWAAVHHGAGDSDVGSKEGERVIVSGVEAEFDHCPTEPVSFDEARAARERTPVTVGIHGAPNCFSCGVDNDSMGVHPGPLDDGRYATDFAPPDWAIGDDGVDLMVFWVALDCTAGVFVGDTPPGKVVVTAQYQVAMAVDRLEPGPYTLVAYDPPADHPERRPGWDGRKRHACSAAFAADGTLVAQANSFWISLPES